MAGQGAGQVKRALKPGFLAGIVMNQKQHVLHLRLPRISFRSRGRCWTGMAMRSLRNITRVLTLATSGKSLLSTVSRTAINLPMKRTFQIGRASCRERVCQYVYISEVDGSLKKKNTVRQLSNKERDK